LKQVKCFFPLEEREPDVNLLSFFFVQSRVIKTKSVEYMPFLLSLVSFLNGCCWTAYALIRFDLYVTVSITGLSC
jgi:hypothetical protein